MTILFFLFFLVVPRLSAVHSSLSQSTEELLQQIDHAIADKPSSRLRYEERLHQLKINAQQVAGRKRIQIYQQLFLTYAHFQCDSALNYLDKLALLNEQYPDVELSQWCNIARAEIYGIMGLYRSAASLLEKNHVYKENPSLRLYYYQVARSVYGWMADYGEIGDNREALLKLTSQYRDSILLVEKNSNNRAIVLVDKYLNNGNMQAGRELALKTLSNADTLQQAYLYSLLADWAKESDNTEEYIHYLALTALSDLKRGVTEYRALLQLAVQLSEEGDITRAYNYLLCAMDDANFCKARLRSFEASNVFPIINGAHKDRLQTRQVITYTIAAFSIAIVVLLTLFVLLLRRQMRKLRKARHEVSEALTAVREVNAALLAANERLSTSDKVKETYVARYLQRCRGYIDTLDEYRRELLKLAKAKNYAQLTERLQSSEQQSREEQAFYADFDEAFVTLFPHFVENFNALLQPDAQVHPKRDEILSTELRIFALIRLGVTDSNRIAHFLNYSVPTIYSYRSRLRNKSLLPKTEFDQAVLSC